MVKWRELTRVWAAICVILSLPVRTTGPLCCPGQSSPTTLWILSLLVLLHSLLSMEEFHALHSLSQFPRMFPRWKNWCRTSAPYGDRLVYLYFGHLLALKSRPTRNADLRPSSLLETRSGYLPNTSG
ncbi:hypothetical protein GDO81_020866 [Engystomops pustulosus]|uniref:Uncharacterized protein n=1 Tax=Engystomops pustulosus TaxID=76066 RepID=A0AAV6Z8Y8_ENGPU|nr:hypothetical protein GDO81_020866 [Engystomops pustulosus]